jgi:hypothetical protein
MSGRSTVGTNDIPRACALQQPVFPLLEHGPLGPRGTIGFGAGYLRDLDEDNLNAYVVA